MPQTKKSVRGAGGASRPGDPEPGDPDPGDPEPGEPPPPSPQEGRLAGGGRGGVELEQGDPDIVKSPSDPKKYRFLELGNGLRVLLISDLSRANENEEGQQEESEGDEEEEDDEEDDEEGESSASSDEEEEEESDEEEEPELMEVDEEDRTKKKSSEKQAAAALCVGVGSFCDPDDLPGLAHFLEHMVFMGSEKFPAENDFDAFLKRHGGSDNASTDCERTVFQFDIQRKFFREALDRWAQFFICPLMVQDALDREVEAVDSEYQLARPSDSHRKEMLFGSLARPGHPMTKFCWGELRF
ncbi:nardilysin-like [Poecilia reticulata]|uniref:nardilysin-like n=1 Tax=Poecilia reticulata TaxID=8081 RepID=UPI0007E9A724|nr:PREDICTED: nardilysin-like [Poecilia reticulata]